MTPQAEQIVVLCPCGKKLKAPASAVGRRARCPKCGNVMTLHAEQALPTGGAPLVSRSVPPPPPPPQAVPKKVAPPPPPPPAEEDDGIGLGALYDLAQESEQAAAAPQSPRCPKCFNEMPINGVLCTNCGFDTRAGKVVKAAGAVAPEKEKKSGWLNYKSAKKDKAVDMMAPQGSFMLGIAGSSVGAAIGGVVWFLIAWGTGYELGFVAIGLGALAGIGMQIGQKGYSTLGGVTAAGITFLAMILAKAAVLFVVVLPILRSDGAGASSGGDGDDEVDSELVEFVAREDLKAQNVDPDTATEKQLDSAQTVATKKLKKMSATEIEAVQKRYDAAAEHEEKVDEMAAAILEERKIDPDNADAAQELAARKEAEKRIAAGAPVPRTNQRSADASNSSSNQSSGGSALVGTAALIFVIFLIFGWKSLIFMILALAMAYKTAAGAVSG